MAEDYTQYQIANNEKFQAALNEAQKKVKDLTVPLTIISNQWFKSNRAFFKLKGPGKFIDLSPVYKDWKSKKLGSPYPILKLGGRLEKSITDPTHEDSVNEIINKNALFMGTKVESKGKNPHPYAKALHFGTKKMPARPFVMIGPEQVTGPPEFNKRTEAWILTLNDYIQKKLDEAGRKSK